MSDLKRLFKRDRFYWGIIPVIMTLVAVYTLTNASGLNHKLFHPEHHVEWSRRLHEIWDAHPELRNLTGDCSDEISGSFLEYMGSVTVMAVLIAQAVRLLAQETRNRMEVQCIFPVKSRSLLTCHYLSGLLTAGIPLLIQTAVIRLDILYIEKNTDFVFTNKEQLWIYAGQVVMVFMLHYSLLLVCKRVTNHVPGTLVTFVVLELASLLSVRYCSFLYWENLSETTGIQTWIFGAAAVVVLISLSYIADYKKDYARNGFYAFPIVHWVMMGIVFGEVYCIFYDAYGDIHKAVSFLVTITASVLITAGAHFVMKPKRIA